jgi:hypothetical protein
MNSGVGGNDDKNYINRQMTNIQNSYNYLPFGNNPSKENGIGYDPSNDYLNSKGLLGNVANNNGTEHQNNNSNKYDNNKYDRYHQVINSKDRQIKPRIETNQGFFLGKEKVSTTFGSSIITMTHSNHGLKINDKITISNLIPRSAVLRTITSQLTEEDSDLLSFVEGSQYLRINYKHEIPHDVDPDDSDNHQYDPATYDTSDLFVEISGIKGSGDNNFIGNIPINTINGTHQIYLVIPEDDNVFSENVFYIKLIKEFTGTYGFTSYNVLIKFNYYYGIPINKINTNDLNITGGYYLITSVTNNTFTIDCGKVAAISTPRMPRNSDNTSTFNENIIIALVTDIVKGYADPNSYNIVLGKTYKNINSVRMISSIFPNTEKAIKSKPFAKKNNVIYWQNLEDGDNIYSAEVHSGNYNATSLTGVLQNAIYNVPKVNQLDNDSESNTQYTNKNYIKIHMDLSSDIVTMKSYKEAFIAKPIIGVLPDPRYVDPVTATSYIISISHANHGLSIGDVILMSNAISHVGIPSSVLNTEHTITEVVDNNTYKFVVKYFNIEVAKNDTGGGTAVGMYSPNLFRLRLDYSDSVCKLLGFRDVGESTSITTYSTSISNNDAYVGETGSVSNNGISLSGDNYILVTCKQLTALENTGKIKEGFAKILLSDLPGKILYNTFVPMSVIFNTPIYELTELDIECYTPDGELYDFNGIDHSFTLEIITKSQLPDNTEIIS